MKVAKNIELLYFNLTREGHMEMVCKADFEEALANPADDITVVTNEGWPEETPA